MTNQLFVPYIRQDSGLPKAFKHPIFQLLGLRGVIADHTEAEEQMLQKHAVGRKTIVEIGVAEGASALALRKAADPDAKLYLIDPYQSGRIPGLNFTKFVSHRHVDRSQNAVATWVQDYSFNVSSTWQTPIDFLFIDGDHSYEGCLKDWQEWSPFVVPQGIVVFHDARLFQNGWTKPDWGSVRVVNEILHHHQSAAWKVVDEVDSLVVMQRQA